MKLLLGCDPEVFVRKKGKKFFRSAYGLNEGTKEKPIRVDYGAVQVDGMALEFNIDPASNEDEWYHHIKCVMDQMEESLPKDLEIVATPVAHFTKAHMAKQPEAAIELGCNPDFNAWKNGEVNPRPNGDVPFRTGAGHIHFGWGNDIDITDPQHIEACCVLVKALDMTLGPMCAMFDTGAQRRELYGSAGAFRPKTYGCEYRVLSNAWLRDEWTIRWVYRTCQQVFNLLTSGNFELTSGYKPYLIESLKEKELSYQSKRYIRTFCGDYNNLELPRGV